MRAKKVKNTTSENCLPSNDESGPFCGSNLYVKSNWSIMSIVTLEQLRLQKLKILPTAWLWTLWILRSSWLRVFLRMAALQRKISLLVPAQYKEDIMFSRNLGRTFCGVDKGLLLTTLLPCPANLQTTSYWLIVEIMHNSLLFLARKCQLWDPNLHLGRILLILSSSAHDSEISSSNRNVSCEIWESKNSQIDTTY